MIPSERIASRPVIDHLQRVKVLFQHRLTSRACTTATRRRLGYANSSHFIYRHIQQDSPLGRCRWLKILKASQAERGEKKECKVGCKESGVYGAGMHPNILGRRVY